MPVCSRVACFAVTHSYVWHDSCICVTLHDEFIRVTWLIHMCDMTPSYVWHDSCICVTWFLHMCDMTHSYVWHDSCICVTWLIHTCVMTHSYKCHDSFICVSWLMHACVQLRCECCGGHSYMCHDSFLQVPWPFHMWHNSCMPVCSRVASFAEAIHICDSSTCVPWLMPWPTHSFVMTHACLRVGVLRALRRSSIYVTSSYVCHHLFICVSWLMHACVQVCCKCCGGHSYMWLIHMCAMTYY